MDHKTAQAILVLFVKEQELKKTTTEHFKYSPIRSSKIRRGVISVTISDQLGLTRNPTFYKRLQKVMLSLGCCEIRVEGRNYYGNISFQDGTSEEID